jgi:hypothetical protein
MDIESFYVTVLQLKYDVIKLGTCSILTREADFSEVYTIWD